MSNEHATVGSAPVREHWLRDCWCGRLEGRALEELHLPIGLEGLLLRAGFHTIEQLRYEPLWSLRLVATLPNGVDQVIETAIRKFAEQQAIAHHGGVDNMPIELLELSQRTYTSLKRGQFRTVGQILLTDERGLLQLRNFGQGSLIELRAKLEEHGVVLSAPREQAS